MKKLFLLFAVLFASYAAHAQWETDVRLTNDPFSSLLKNTNNGQAIAASGDSVHIVWYDDRSGVCNIYYKHSLDGGLTWSNDIQLTTEPNPAQHPYMAVSGSTFHVSWDGTAVGSVNTDLYYMRSTDGGNTWENEVRLTANPEDSWANSMAVEGTKVYLVYQFWVDPYTDADIYFKRSVDEGMTWEPEVRLTNDPANSMYSSISANGSALHVVWQDYRDGNWEIYYKHSLDDGNSWGPDTRLTFNDEMSSSPGMATFQNCVHVVWCDYRDGNREIYYKRSLDNGVSWESDIKLTNNPSYSRHPFIAAYGSGLFLTWEDDRDGNKEIYYKYSRDLGTTWGPDTRLTDDDAMSENPFISVSGSQIHVAWQDNRDENYEIYYKRDPTGGLPVGLAEGAPGSFVKRYSVFPNPASRQLTVGQLDNWTVGQSVVGSQQSAVRLSILDSYGREIKAFGTISLFPYHLDISDLPVGIYFLRMIGEKENNGSAKFMKFRK